jgi:hypothetical protein
VAGEQSYLAIGAAIWAEVLMLSLGASLGSSRFFFGHILPAVYSRRIKMKAGQPFRGDPALSVELGSLFIASRKKLPGHRSA